MSDIHARYGDSGYSRWAKEAFKTCEEKGYIACLTCKTIYNLPPMNIFKYGEPFDEVAWLGVKHKYRPREDKLKGAGQIYRELHASNNEKLVQ